MSWVFTNEVNNLKVTHADFLEALDYTNLDSFRNFIGSVWSINKVVIYTRSVNVPTITCDFVPTKKYIELFNKVGKETVKFGITEFNDNE